jgi:hypothetical protein
MADDREIETAFRAGFRAGFKSSREGFNGECAYDALAPRAAWDSDNPLQDLEDRGVAAFLAREMDAFLASLSHLLD